MREEERRRLGAAGRQPMRSPGRPPVVRREERQRFWAAIARGLRSEDAAVQAGVSPAVGTRWFREAGGMPPITQAAVSGRYLSFTEREEIGILRARGCGVREIARRAGRSPATISRELRRNAATRGGGLEYRASTAQWHADRRARRPKAARLSPGTSRCGATSRTGSAARCGGPMTEPAWKARGSAGSAGGTGAVRTGAGRPRGARSRSPAGSGSTSPMMSPCGSRTRRSTRPFTSRAAALSAASSPRACAPGGRCGSRGPGPEDAGRALSAPRS